MVMVQDAPLNRELVSSSHLLIVQNMLSTERIEVLLSKLPLDNSSGPLLNSLRRCRSITVAHTWAQVGSFERSSPKNSTNGLRSYIPRQGAT